MPPEAPTCPPHHGEGRGRHHLIALARSTIKIAEDGRYVNSRGDVVELKSDLDRAVEESAHYEDGFDFEGAIKEYDNARRSERSLGSVEETGDRGEGGNFGGLNSSDRAVQFALSPTSSRRRFPRTSFLVVSASWLESASELSRANRSERAGEVRVGVLNSASGTTPGGRFLKGTVSQEDCLCRASLLYACISQPRFQSENRFYGKNRARRYGTSNCVIFSPDVPVIREDTVEGKLLDSFEEKYASLLTYRTDAIIGNKLLDSMAAQIPAPNAFTTSSNTGREYNDIESAEREQALGAHGRTTSVVDLSQLGGSPDDPDELLERKRRALRASLSDRIGRALSAFVLGGCTDLVLPAFGCGVHGNDPTVVAGVFREMLTDPRAFGGRFDTVVFAIPPSRKQNYQAFAAYFQKEEMVNRVRLSRSTTVD
ncbi:hypothetical protein ACHAWF_004308 [Thalassiosira exigua]